jgi:L-threonylcarbamoyladenylate synthase
VAAARHATRLARHGERVGALLFAGDPLPDGTLVEQLGDAATLEEAARRLYAALRSLDAAAVNVIVARLPEAAGLGLALRDRLRRAAEGRVLTG